ncbi:MAG: hypothetical protein VKN72_03680 [Nostocales cyanobacterium 94392]|nr:hypothetical protein [Nostocales cyanobacterium 94392]
MPQGFGKPQPKKINYLVERAVRYCHKRQPEKLDRIFDNLPLELNQQVLVETVAALHDDIDTQAWFCGYFAGVINRSEDSERQYSITLLSKLLIKSGMEAFEDFVPYPGCQLVIVNTKKFAALPPSVQALMQEAFELTETSGKEVQRVNNALLEELTIKK